MIVRALAKALLLPPTGPLLVALIGLILLRRAPRLGRALAWLGCASLLLLSVPFVAATLARAWIGPLEPLDLARAAQAQAIVVLGSGANRHAPEYGGETVGRYTLERVRYAARLAHKLDKPVLVSGGAVRGRSEAQLMQTALAELGVNARYVEARSRNTHENAQRSAEILEPAGIDEVVLVAHAIDMPRARAEFAAAGLRVVPAPIDLPQGAGDRPGDFVPGIGALNVSWRVLYEAAGDLVRRLAEEPPVDQR
jgi:uncharacterized SAM-binding protein YcdF (DUF218 family)